MKLKEIRESYEDLSRTFSNTVRTLAISGIAIVWLFMDKGNADTKMFVLLFLALLCFVTTLFADLEQNRQLSLTWYKYYETMKEKFHINEDDEVKEPEENNKWGWILYKAKYLVLILGYIFILFSFIFLITNMF